MHTASMDLSARISRKSFTALTVLPALPAVATALSKCGWYTSHTATGSTSGSFSAKPRLLDPIAPMPMWPVAMRSLAPFTRPVNREVVSVAAAPLSRSLLLIIGLCPRKMVLIVKGKIAPLAITLLLPEAVKHFQFLPEYSSHLRRNLQGEDR